MNEMVLKRGWSVRPQGLARMIGTGSSKLVMFFNFISLSKLKGSASYNILSMIILARLSAATII